MRLVFFLFLLSACAPSYFVNLSSITTLDGKELTKEYCTEDLLHYFDLAIEYHRLTAEKESLQADYTEIFGEIKTSSKPNSLIA